MIGIDLGTTNSLCAVFEDGAPKLLRNGAGGLLTPSVVGVSEDEQVLVGSPARELRVTRPDRCAGCFKRWMGTDKEIQIGSHRFTAPELSSLVLRSLKQDAETHLGREVTEAVVTVPAYFNDNQRKATRLAGELAGLNVRRIINEPTAAALTYGFHDRQAEKNLIVIDLGGGTFDVTVMEVFEGTLEIVATAGESFLGGEDFTDRMVAWVLGQRKMALESAELNQPLLVSRLRAECERAKCALAGADEAPIRFPDREGRIDAGAEPVVFSRARFAEITKVLMDRLAGPIHKALRDSGRPKTAVNEVILVGGATRMPLLRDYVRDLFGKDPLTSWDPDHVVALGASIQSALILDDKSVEDMVMTDVCPFTLGVEICKEFGAKVQDGYYLPVIHRNTTIPVSKEEIVNTLRRNQTEVLVKIYQGEGRRVKDNLCLGELSVKGIPPGEAGQPVHLRFTYDLNGILEVEAFLPQTGKKYQTVLTQHTKGLSPDAMQEAVRNLQKLKVYPRHEVATQNLIRFTERVIGEVNPFDRQSLEEELDRFEMSCSSGDRELFEQCRQSLIMMLSGLGFPPAEDAETRTDDDA